MAVDEIRGRLKRPGDVSVDLGHALAAYADQLDAVGRVSEAADVTAEVVAYWREHSDSTAQFLFAVDRLGERLVRSGRTEEAGACITEAIRKVRRRKPQHELARIWHDFSVRLLSLDLPTNALEPGMKAVKLHRELAYWAREHHRKVETADDWDDDHRYTWAYLLQRRREELKSSHDDVRRAERNLREGLLTLSACLRRLDRLDEATAAEAEAAASPSPWHVRRTTFRRTRTGPDRSMPAVPATGDVPMRSAPGDVPMHPPPRHQLQHHAHRHRLHRHERHQYEQLDRPREYR